VTFRNAAAARLVLSEKVGMFGTFPIRSATRSSSRSNSGGIFEASRSTALAKAAFALPLRSCCDRSSSRRCCVSSSKRACVSSSTASGSTCHSRLTASAIVALRGSKNKALQEGAQASRTPARFLRKVLDRPALRAGEGGLPN